MSGLLLAYHPAFQEHDAGPGHPERPQRVGAVMDAIRGAQWFDRVEVVEAREATPQEVALAHSPTYVEAMRRLCESGGEFLAPLEATVGPRSYPAALRAAGAGLTLADRIMQNSECKVQNEMHRDDETVEQSTIGEQNSSFILHPSSFSIGFAPTRPPGHHATHDRPMGFCIFNNIAILAHHLLKTHGLSRVAIYDFDVHHGNGTEAAFWEDRRVLYCSTHRDNFYPYNKGRRSDHGEGAGEGFTVNVPLPAGIDDDEYLKAVDRYILPKVEEFAPEFVLVSAGFDLHRRDPLGGMRITGDGFAAIAERVLKMASGSADGRIITLLEGGYDLEGLAEGVTRFLGRLIEG